LLGENRGHGDAVRHVIVARLALLAAVRLRAQAIGACQEVDVEAVALQRDRPGELRGEEGSGAGHLWRMASRGHRVNAGTGNTRPLL